MLSLRNFAIVGFLIIGGAFAYAAIGISRSPQVLVAETQDCGCAKLKDQKLKPARVEFGAFQGQCVDTCKFQPVWSQAESQETIEIGNILAKGEYWSGRFDTRELLNAEVLLENFSPHVNHVALKFDFKYPVKIFPQTTEGQVITSQSLLISVEAAHPLGMRYNFRSGFLGDFPMVVRALTYEDFSERAKKDNTKLERLPIAVSPRELQSLLRIALASSGELSYQSKYQLVFNNCATAAIDLILKAKGQIPTFGPSAWFKGISLDNAFGTNSYLRQTGLVL